MLHCLTCCYTCWTLPGCFVSTKEPYTATLLAIVAKGENTVCKKLDCSLLLFKTGVWAELVCVLGFDVEACALLRSEASLVKGQWQQALLFLRLSRQLRQGPQQLSAHLLSCQPRSAGLHPCSSRACQSDRRRYLAEREPFIHCKTTKVCVDPEEVQSQGQQCDEELICLQVTL